MYLVSEFRILMPLSMLSLMYGRYTKPPSWRNLAKRPTPQRGSRDAAECADAGCTGATGTRGYGGCAGAAVLGCGRGVPLKTAVESSPWTERGAPKSALTHQKQTPNYVWKCFAISIVGPTRSSQPYSSPCRSRKAHHLLSSRSTTELYRASGAPAATTSSSGCRGWTPWVLTGIPAQASRHRS